MSAIQNIQESLKGLSVEELLAVITAAAAEAKKAVKATPKKEVKEKKGSMPKGVVPPQLHKPRAWVDFVLAHANENGWPAITVKGQEEPLPASVERDGAHVFESTGKPLNNKQAMSLSKQYWDRKAGVGSQQNLYETFESYYVPPTEVEVTDVAEATETTEAAKAAEAPKPKKEKKAVKSDEEKAAEKLAKEAEKQAKKEAEKEAKAAAKAATKAAEKEAKKAAEKPKEEPKEASKEAKKVVKKTVKKEETVFECEDDGMAREWDFKGKKFLRDFDGNMWHRTDDGESNGWAGKFDSATNTIDASAEEPVYEDEE